MIANGRSPPLSLALAILVVNQSLTMKLFFWLAAVSGTLMNPAMASTNNNSIAEIGAESVLVDDGGCMSLCTGTDACRNDPHAHGSYCKFWQTPAVCFGMSFVVSYRPLLS